jgi:hypothetical protein
VPATQHHRRRDIYKSLKQKQKASTKVTMKVTGALIALAAAAPMAAAIPFRIADFVAPTGRGTLFFPTKR